MSALSWGAAFCVIAALAGCSAVSPATSAAAYLLRHFLSGEGTRVDYPAGSPISKEALASSAFQAVNNEVRQAVLLRLKAGPAHVRLSATQLPTVAFESKTSDLYRGFRGTQGLTVTGGGSRGRAPFGINITSCLPGPIRFGP